MLYKWPKYTVLKLDYDFQSISRKILPKCITVSEG